MKFKKRDLSEQLGMTRSNRKTFTKDAKQKIVVSEEQLQRLLSRINEQGQGYNCEQTSNGCTCVVPVFGTGTYSTIKDCEKAKNCCNGKSKPKGTGRDEPKFNFSKWSSEFKRKIDTFIKNGKLDKAKKFLDEKVSVWGGKAKKAGPKWKSQLNQKITFGKKMLTTVATEKKKKPVPSTGPTNPNANSGKKKPPIAPKPSPTNPNEVKEDDGSGNQTSPVRKPCRKCCKPEGKPVYSLAQKPGRPCECPKSHPEVPCKGTPPTQGNITTEIRKLKTTNPINETDIKNMKKWFKRVNKTGVNYNPSID